MATLEQEITLEKKGKIALITLNREKKLNALDSDLYYRLAMLMNEVAAMPEITITVLTGKGRFFSAYVYSFPFSIAKVFMQSFFLQQLTTTIQQRRRRRNISRST
jgi:hypothetical protein